MQRVIQILHEIAILLDLSNHNRFKGKAIRKAIRTLEASEADIQELVMAQNLRSLPGIGLSLERVITEIVLTGKSTYHERLQRIVPLSLAPLLKISGFRSGEILQLFQHYRIRSLEDYLKCSAEQLLTIGISKNRQSRIRKNIAEYLKYGTQHLWSAAKEIGNFLVKKISGFSMVKRCVLSGEVRRLSNTVRQLDLIIETSDIQKTIEWVLESPWMNEAVKKTAKILIFKGPSELTVKLTFVKKEFEWNLFKTTGSSGHLRAFKTYSRASTEEEIYSRAGLQYIPPELRENRGEIEAALKGALPQLVKEKDIKGVFHCHTIDSDGSNTFVELAEAAEKLYGWSYIGISDHSKSCVIAGGMNEETLIKQTKAIQEYNESKVCSCRVFSGIECDILLDGSLDFSDEILKSLDFVIVSIHSHFNLSKSLMTKRLIKAIENPYTTIVGHVMGRLLLHRPGYKLDLDKVIDACVANQKVIEINGHPSRLDMDWKFWHKAKDRGLKCAINPDAHSVYELKYYSTGINVARKGWLSAEDIMNTKMQPLQ